ncbi:MAG: hypothetical protein SYC29_09065 [Planctomycetota bacterium]|nr:hypothetical protein [Planctomycetota bacterium]
MIRPDSPEWVAAKAEGDRAEIAVARWFKSRGFDPYQSVDDAAIDLLLQCFVEVKHDRKALQTGNVAIETHYRRQPSGLLTSPAQWWAIVIGSEAVICETPRLREFVLSGDFRECPAGDGKLATVRLVPLENLKGWAGPNRVIALELGE